MNISTRRLRFSKKKGFNNIIMGDYFSGKAGKMENNMENRKIEDIKTTLTEKEQEDEKRDYYQEVGIMDVESNLKGPLEWLYMCLNIRKYNVNNIGNGYMVTSFNEEIRQIRTIYRHEDMKMYSLLKDKEYENHMIRVLYNFRRDLDIQFLYAVIAHIGTDMAIQNGNIKRDKVDEISDSVLDRINPKIEDKEEKCNKKNHSKLKRNGAIISNKKWKIGNGKVEQGNLNYKLIGEPIDLYSNEYFQNLLFLMVNTNLRFLLKINKKRTFGCDMSQIPYAINENVIEDYYYQKILGIKNFFVFYSYFGEESLLGITKKVRENIKGIIKQMKIIENPYICLSMLEKMLFVSSIYYNDSKLMVEKLNNLLKNSQKILIEMKGIGKQYEHIYYHFRVLLDIKCTLIRLFWVSLNKKSLDVYVRLYESSLLYAAKTEAEENNAKYISKFLDEIDDLMKQKIKKRKLIENLEEVERKMIRKWRIEEREGNRLKSRTKLEKKHIVIKGIKKIEKPSIRRQYEEEIRIINNKHLKEIEKYLNANKFFTFQIKDDFLEKLGETQNVDLLNSLKSDYRVWD